MSEKEKREKQYLNLVQGLNAPAKEVTPARKRQPKPPKVSESESLETPEPMESEPTVKATVYIPKSLHRRVRVALADREERLTLTDLVIDLLKKWADKQ